MELFRALAVFAEPPGTEHTELAALLGLPRAPTSDEYAGLFLFQLYPYASVYLGPEGMMGGDARERIAGFWRALGLVPPPEPDHLSSLLALYSTLCDNEANEADQPTKLLWRHSRSVLLFEHLASWLIPYVLKLREIAPEPYRIWGEMLLTALHSEAILTEAVMSRSMQFNEAGGIPDMTDIDVGSVIRHLLAPLKSGVILVRSDLQRAAGDLGLGLRAGERRYALASLVSQDPSALLGWLAKEARRQAGMYELAEADFADIAGDWKGRALATAALLGRMQAAVSELPPR